MIERATSPERPFDLILVHSLSRFFRDQYLSEFYIRRLRKAKVEVVSITQPFQDDPTGNMVRNILSTFDEYQSRETAKHTTRAMTENARQGFWNGSVPPFGYKTIVAETRGQKSKKRLTIDETEAQTVRAIFDMALGRHGPVIGVKAIVNRLNARGDRLRGKPFHISNVHRILTGTTYAGTAYFNRRCSRTGEMKDEKDWIALAVPPIVSREEFDQVQASLANRRPSTTAPRVTAGPTLLTGIASCGTCGSGMTIRTGKSGRYRYYTCAGCAQKGKTTCSGRSISMAALDGMILEHMSDTLFTPPRLAQILEAYISQSEETEGARKRQISAAKAKETEIKGKIARLLDLVASGGMEANDPQLKDKLADLRSKRAAFGQEIDLLTRTTGGAQTSITPEKLSQLAALLRTALKNPNQEFRRAYLRLFLDKVVVGDREIVLSGPKRPLADSAATERLPDAASLVPSFVREWRPRRDSNPRPPD